jgi:glycosyltransferase involved in cell wall biosynthesis
MSKEIDLSICIATYNMKEVLWQTIHFIKSKITTINYEIIIYDDCSTDGTDKIKWFKKYKNIIYRRAEHNRGVGEAFNRAINLAKGRYVMLMCADDILLDSKYITDSLYVMDRNPELGYVTRYYYQYIDWDWDVPVR